MCATLPLSIVEFLSTKSTVVIHKVSCKPLSRPLAGLNKHRQLCFQVKFRLWFVDYTNMLARIVAACGSYVATRVKRLRCLIGNEYVNNRFASDIVMPVVGCYWMDSTQKKNTIIIISISKHAMKPVLDGVAVICHPLIDWRCQLQLLLFTMCYCCCCVWRLFMLFIWYWAPTAWT